MRILVTIYFLFFTLSYSYPILSAEKPNFVVIMVDDMGYTDPQCFGGEIDTAHINGLADGGLPFSQFYNCARCCPTRGSLLTGSYPHRVGLARNGKTMAATAPTLAELLKPVGYQTRMTAKWHLSQLAPTNDNQQRIQWINQQLDLGVPFADPASFPRKRGFDHFYGVIWGVVDYFDPFSLIHDDHEVNKVSDDFYLTDAVTDYSVDYIHTFEKNDEEPFFLYVAYTAPHWPLHAKDDVIRKYQGKYDAGWNALKTNRFQRQKDKKLFPRKTPIDPLMDQGNSWENLIAEEKSYQAGKMEVHAAMIDSVDQGIGRIIDALKETGEFENTVIFFHSDNRASPEIPGYAGYDRNGETRDGAKSHRVRELQQPKHCSKLGSAESYTGLGPAWANAATNQAYKPENEPVNKGKPTMASSPPNIILVMADDLAWMDLACQGNPLVETPFLDQFASEGIRFTNAYAASPVCSPTRAALITGLAPARLRITNHIPDRPQFTPEGASHTGAKMVDHLAPSYTTIAERLKEAGYATGFFGKWHIAGTGTGPNGQGTAKYYPENQGFDVNIGGCIYGGPPTFFDPYRIHNLADRQEGEYLPDRLADEVCEFIDKAGDSPFFTCLWNYSVHWPMEAPEHLLKKYESRTGPGLNDIRYGAMIEALDASFGKIMAHLDKKGLRDNTLVIFTSDNGGFAGVSDNRPLRESKGHIYEGGIRVPLMIRWPNVIKPNQLNDTPVISMDFFPTILDVCNLKAQPICDGVSLTPLFRNNQISRTNIFFHFPNYAWHRSNSLAGAVRSGDYKLIRHYTTDRLELYNLTKDKSETNNLANARPKLAKRLNSDLSKWLLDTNAAMPRKLPIE